MTATASDESVAGSSLEENLEDDPVLEEILKGDPDGSQLLADLTAKTQFENRALLAEWRSLKQLENGSPSTSPPYWDTDDDAEGAKPSELHGKHTWRIEKFSQINKRELRSDIFEAGGYQWYILIYPQGCDVCNHLSLFLCVANHDKLLPGWSHFAQFTIAVVNKDPKKSKYSDTLHRFWKKEHDWGWKKFMELSKVFDGFIDSDALVIKAQVQVIRERADRPFRCLDCQYRRELVRVYLSNVEQICRKFVEEKRTKLKELIEDKARWSSFCGFWSGMDQNVRRRMSREKTGVILKVVVKQFFIEKEVTSTLVMDSLYSGLKALESQSRCDKGRIENDEILAPIVHVEKDMFVLVDDVLLLLERAAMEPLPPKDDKGPQNRTKDGITGEECNLLSIERDETRLTEMGRRTVETFVLAHIFSRKIEVAHQEAVALKRQEELIREEEEAWLVETEQKAKRKVTEKEKKSKQKQAKQKRNNRKTKDKGRDESVCAAVVIREAQEIANDEMKGLIVEQTPVAAEKSESPEEISDVSDSIDYVAPEVSDPSPLIWDDISEIIIPPTVASSSGIFFEKNYVLEKKSSSVLDDSSSTCSTDSVPSVMVNGRCKGNSFSNSKTQKFPRRGKNPQGKYDTSSLGNERDGQPSASISDPRDMNDTVAERDDGPEQVSGCILKKNTMKVDAGERKAACSLREQDIAVATVIPSSSRSLPRNNTPSPIHPLKLETKISTTTTTTIPVVKKSTPKPEVLKPAARVSTDIKPQIIPPMSRPSTTPLRPPPVTLPSAVQTPPVLARSVSAAGWLALPDPPPHGYIQPQSYRNAIVGNNNNTHPPVFVHPSPPPERFASFSVGMVKCDVVRNGGHEGGGEVCSPSSCSSLVDDIQKLDLDLDLECAGTSGRLEGLGLVADDFPHLDIINDLLDDEQGGSAGMSDGGGGRRYYSFPGDGREGGWQLNPFVGGHSYNGQVMDGQQWRVVGGGGSDVSVYGGFQIPEYQRGGVNGYAAAAAAAFRPSNGY